MCHFFSLVLAKIYKSQILLYYAFQRDPLLNMILDDLDEIQNKNNQF